MTNKFEEFKKWFMELEKIPTKFRLDDFCFSSSMPIPAAYATLEINREEIFKLFEEYQQEEKRKERFKDIIDEIIPYSEDTITSIYNALKEEGLLR